MKRKQKENKKEYRYSPQMFAADFTLAAKITGDSSDLEKAVDSAGDSMQTLPRAAKDAVQGISDHFSKIQGVLNGVGSSFKSAGKTMSVAVTAPVVAIGKKSVDAFYEVDTGLDNIIKKTGASGDVLSDYKEILEDIATTIPVSFGDAGSAIGEVNTRFGLTGADLDKLSTKFLQFAELNNTDVTSSIDSVQQVMAAFGVETKDAGLFLDTLNKTGQDTGTDMNTLLGLMGANATTMKELGYSASDSAVFLGNLSKNGIESSAVMTGLKKAMVNAVAEGKSMPDALAELQAAMADTSGDANGLQMAIDLFGSKAGPAIYDACQDGRLSFEQLGTSMTDFEGSVQNTFEATQDPADDFQLAMNNLKLTGSDLGDTIQQRLSPHIDELSKKISELRTWFNELSPEQQDALLAFAAIAAVIGPALVILGTLISSIGSIAGAIGGLTGFIAGLIPEGMTLSGLFGSIASAVALPIAIIGLLVGAFVYLWQTNEDFRNAIMEIWDSIVQKITDFVESVKEKLAEAGITAETLQQAWETVVQFIKDVWQGLCDFLAPIFISVFETISNLLGDVLDIILGIIDFWISVFTGDWSGAWDAVKEIVDGCLKFIDDLVQGFIDLIDTHFHGLADFLEGIWNTIKSVAETVWNAIKTAVLVIIMLFCDLISGDFDKLKEHLSKIWDKIKEKAGEIWEGIKQTVSDFVSGLVDFIKEHIDEVPGIIEDGFQAAIDFITGLPEQAVTWGSDIIDGIVDGIWSGIGRIQDAAAEIAGTISGFLGFSEPEVGPLSDFHTYMPDMIGLLVKGMDAGASSIERAAANLAGGIYSGITGGATSQAGARADVSGGTSIGGIHMVVNGAQGQDVSALADIVTDRIMRQITVYA